MFRVNIVTFGVVTHITGKSNFTVRDVANTQELRNMLETEFPSLRKINYAIAVNKQLVSASTRLEENATVALLPPFSGG